MMSVCRTMRQAFFSLSLALSLLSLIIHYLFGVLLQI